MFSQSTKIILLCSVVANLLGISSSQSLPLTQIGSKKYYVHDTSTMNWFLANHFCRRNGMQLLTINSAQENNDIITYIRSNPAINGNAPSNSVWTSLTDYGQQGVWISISTGQAAPYLNWSPTSPDNSLGVQHVVALWAPQNYQMNDEVYSAPHYFLCEETPCNKKCGNNNCCGGCC